MILFDSPEAATYKTGIEGWVSADGFYCGKDERLARYRGCTHVKCEECGSPCTKGWLKCDSCRSHASQKRWAAFPHEEWDGKKPIYLWDGNQFFFSEDELIDWLYDNEANGDEVMLVICEPICYRPIDTETIAGDAHEDWEPSDELAQKINEFNAYLKTLPPHSYTVGKIRTSYDYTYKPED